MSAGYGPPDPLDRQLDRRGQRWTAVRRVQRFRVLLEELLARTTDFSVSGEILMARWAEWGTRAVPLSFLARSG
ncbi:hypothetical protein [Prauserella cavernicola]|uniref:Uncharacterized protein n=1 Tax=Prauserella cavernicola TaxID=2800127 RepID=A0A934V490_9PSEU|nr:hypothetical protein [Prauserella cavernicola]MBK1783328.1 hypothetical protein [Prauserella cavernicola]